MIDVSDAQGNIVWDKVTAKRALIQVAHGLATEESGSTNIRNARATGHIIGPYLFLEDSAASTQVAHFLNLFRPGVGDVRGMIDIEPSAFSHPTFTLATDAYRSYHAATGHWPILYGTSDVLGGLHLEADAANCPLMLADWGPNDGKIHPVGSIPAPWKTYAIHQYTDMGHMAGIAGTVDLDLVADPEAIMVPRPRPLIDKWEVSYVKKKEGRVRVYTRAPTSFQARHPGAKYRGAIHVYPHRKEKG